MTTAVSVPCPACESTDFEPFASGGDYHYSIDGEFALERCCKCDLWRLSPMLTASELAAFYPDDYYSYQPPVLESGAKRLLRQLAGLDRRTLVPAFKAPGRMVDIGCGAGHYLLRMQSEGWEVKGIELSKAAAAAGRAAGLDIRGGEIYEVGLDQGSFDFVRFNHSFEHVPDPLDVLVEVKKLIKPGGALFIGVPNTKGLWAKLFHDCWWYFGLPVHTYGFNARNLSLLLNRAGYEVETVRYHSEYAGLLGSLQIWLNKERGIRRSTGRIQSSRLLRLPALWICRLLDTLRMGDSIEVIARPIPA